MPEHAKYNYWHLCGIRKQVWQRPRDGSARQCQRETQRARQCQAGPDRARQVQREPGRARQHQPAGLINSQDPLLLQGKWELRTDQSWSHFYTKRFDFCLKNSPLHPCPSPCCSGLPWLPVVLYSSP